MLVSELPVVRLLRSRGNKAFRDDHRVAAAEKINASYVARILRLTLLAPEVVEAILDGKQPGWMTLPGLVGGVVAQWNTRQGVALPREG